MKYGKAPCTKACGAFLYNLSKLGYSAVGRALVLYTASPRFESWYPNSGEMQSPEISLTPRQTPRQDKEGSTPSARFIHVDMLLYVLYVIHWLFQVFFLLIDKSVHM